MKKALSLLLALCLVAALLAGCTGSSTSGSLPPSSAALSGSAPSPASESGAQSSAATANLSAINLCCNDARVQPPPGKRKLIIHIDVDCLSNRVFFAKNGIYIIRKIVHYAIRGFHFSMRRTIAAACPQLTDRYRLIVRVFRRALLCFVYVAYSKEKGYNEKSHYRQTISYSKGLPLLFFRHLSLTYTLDK